MIRRKVAPDKLFTAAVDKLWNSLTARHRGANRAKYGEVPITKADLRVWMLEQSIDGRGLAWRCQYSGNILTYAAKVMSSRLTLDHIVPLANGGESRLSNLAIISQEENLAKGEMSFGYYGRLKAFIAPWPENERRSVMRRLIGYRPGWRQRK